MNMKVRFGMLMRIFPVCWHRSAKNNHSFQVVTDCFDIISRMMFDANIWFNKFFRLLFAGFDVKCTKRNPQFRPIDNEISALIWAQSIGKWSKIRKDSES